MYTFNKILYLFKFAQCRTSGGHVDINTISHTRLLPPGDTLLKLGTTLTMEAPGIMGTSRALNHGKIPTAVPKSPFDTHSHMRSLTAVDVDKSCICIWKFVVAGGM